MLQDWVLVHSFRILIILVLAVVINYIAAYFIESLVRRAVKSNVTSRDTTAEKKREDTLIKIFQKTVGVIIWLVAGMTVLAEFGVDIGPLLAAAGIAGLAFGFGGQYLIRDLISGAFIIIENQYRVGDVVCFDSTCGLVEDISIRMTTLRDLDGVVHHVPQGEIKKVSNLSKGFSRVNINLGVDYSSDLEKVIEVINLVGKEMMEDSEWKQYLLSAPKFLRVDAFGESAIMMKILADTIPLKQWDVGGELRKRIKIAFDKNGIRIPFPRRDIHYFNSTEV